MTLLATLNGCVRVMSSLKAGVNGCDAVMGFRWNKDEDWRQLVCLVKCRARARGHRRRRAGTMSSATQFSHLAER
jgi:hypothetical protein